MLRRETEEARETLLLALVENPLHAPLSEEDLAMLRYAERLTKSPAAMREADVAELREHGFSDRAIHDICGIVSYFAFVNRIADGLGVELEEEEAP